MYKQIIGFEGVRDDIIQKIDGGLLIPFDPANTDHQAYLKWLAEGNTPLPAEETP